MEQTVGERLISVEGVSPVDFFGVNNVNIEFLRSVFPKLKLIIRGNEIKCFGAEDELVAFDDVFKYMLLHYNKFALINLSDVKLIASSSLNNIEIEGLKEADDEVLVYGRSGKIIKALTSNQTKMVESSKENDIVFAIGPAGTGKTYTAVALAVQALKNREVKRIVLTRPAVEAGENLGFLPGDMRDKLDPYLQPLYDALRDMLPSQKLNTYLEDHTIEIAPLAFMRGRTLDHAYVILDEAQNTTSSQLKMFLTRMGKSAKFIITGDITQIDLPRNQKSGLLTAQHILKDIIGIDFILLDESDVVRHKLVAKIIAAYRKIENE